MRLLLQRVTSARVSADGKVVGEIGKGLLIFVGIGKADTEAEARALAEKCLDLRIFADTAGKMNLSLRQAAGEVLVVPQFTLYADLDKGLRPNFTQAAPPAEALRFYDFFCEVIRGGLGKIQTGVFGAHMEVSLVNDGPVTFWMES